MILAITPARGGSKGIPRKNIRMIAGKPLIAWTIDAAKKSRMIDKYVVSTEDREIAKISGRRGAEVLHRPSVLAKDRVSTLRVLQHAVKAIPCDIVVVLQATSPVRREGLIDDCIRRFIKGRYDSLATGFMCKCREYGKNELRRQDIKGFFYDDGNVYIIKAELIKKGDRYGKKIGRYITSRSENADIDDEFDLFVTGKILEKRKTVEKKSKPRTCAQGRGKD